MKKEKTTIRGEVALLLAVIINSMGVLLMLLNCGLPDFH